MDNHDVEMYVCITFLALLLTEESFYGRICPFTLGSSGEWSEVSFHHTAVEYKTE
jgi:hypothetical protein